MPALLISMVQGIVSAIPINLAASVLLWLFAFLKSGQDVGVAFFTWGAYLVSSAYVTLVSNRHASGWQMSGCLG
jgi:hypothetical protein